MNLNIADLVLPANNRTWISIVIFCNIINDLFCFYRFYSETLWTEIKDETDIADVTSTWMITLEKKGCNIMVRAGMYYKTIELKLEYLIAPPFLIGAVVVVIVW